MLLKIPFAQKRPANWRKGGERLSKKDVILNSIQNLLPLIKAGDQSVAGHSTGSGSGMTISWLLFESHILFGQPQACLLEINIVGFRNQKNKIKKRVGVSGIHSVYPIRTIKHHGK